MPFYIFYTENDVKEQSKYDIHWMMVEEIKFI